jgi:ubiquinone biosynthesis protein
MRRGRMAIEFQHRGLENVIQGLDRSFNRLAFSLIIAAVFVGSSLIMRLEKGPTLLGYPFFGLIGYVVAGVMGFGLVFAIFRSKKF